MLALMHEDVHARSRVQAERCSRVFLSTRRGGKNPDCIRVEISHRMGSKRSTWLVGLPHRAVPTAQVFKAGQLRSAVKEIIFDHTIEIVINEQWAVGE